MPGTDLREGVHTLPVLYALQDSGPQADRLRELLAGPVDDDAALTEALDLLRRSPAWPRPRTPWPATRLRPVRSWPSCPMSRPPSAGHAGRVHRQPARLIPEPGGLHGAFNQQERSS
ncbi:trans-hexaprenyltranstransferase domain protein [Mycobacterium xenopi 3993]|nr:trans-hexaprenyltranstransferase domain protein [Mycobacterium xenopi 3993]